MWAGGCSGRSCGERYHLELPRRGTCIARSCWRGLLLLALARAEPPVPVQKDTVTPQESCDDSRASRVRFDHPKVVLTGMHSEAKHASFWSFDANTTDVRITVTPAEHAMDPDISLYIRMRDNPALGAAGTCQLLASAQDYGGDMLAVSNLTTRQLNITRYYLRVWCRTACDYHVAFQTGDATNAREEIKIGETKSGIAYRGTPLHFFFDCSGECEQAALQGTNRRLTISAWPRDATSVHHLTLLVRKDKEPSTADKEHLEATRGWFSGEVVGTPAEAGRYYVTVLKKHGRTPLPFVLTVTLPDTVQMIPLGKPFFGAVTKNQMAFYKFKVDNPNTDIEAYLTSLDGDPDMAMSHETENPKPTPLSAQWHSRKMGDDEIVVTPDDPKRRSHPTGWFHIGVHGFKNTAFSLIVLAEPHVAQDTQPGEVIDWTELWLGLPQTLSARPGKAGNFLFYSQLVTSRLFVQIQTLEGEKPDACMALCGSDPHQCPYISPFANSQRLAMHDQGVISDCGAARLQGKDGGSQATITQPCSSCWYALLVTSEAAKNRTKFRVLLGAEGRAHPLVAGESFRGHVDAHDAAVLLVYDLGPGELEAKSKANSTLRIVMTTIYGDPMFAVRSGAEDGPVLFASNVTGRDDFSLRFQPGTGEKQNNTYYIVVWAASKHAQFRIQASWELSSKNASQLTDDTLLGVGVPVLRDGREQYGTLEGGKPMAYLYRPEGNGNTKPSIRIGVRARRHEELQVFVIPVDAGTNPTAAGLASALLALQEKVKEGPAKIGWISEKATGVVTIPSSDPKYLAPGSGHVYAIAVYTLVPDLSADSRITFTIEAATDEIVEELLVTGTPVRGVVQAGEYKRYRITVADSGKHLAIMLKAISGDADLYLGFNASVGRGNSTANSSQYGGDTILLPANGEVNRQHCSKEVIAIQGECVYFVAVLGTSKNAEFEISALVPNGAPQLLAPSGDAVLMVPGGGVQHLFIPLVFPMRPMTVEVTAFTGSVARLSAKIVSLAKAKHPDQQLKTSSLVEADLEFTKFAGVWSTRLANMKAYNLCKAAADESGCAVFITLRAHEALTGRATLLVDSAGPVQQGASASTSPSSGELLVLQAGVPSRGSLRNAQDILCYGFVVRESTSDLSVSVTPLTNCTPVLQLEFPNENEGVDGTGHREIANLHTDPRLGFISARIPHMDPRFRAGLYYLWVRQQVAVPCEFDVRAQLDAPVSAQDFSGNEEEPLSTPTILLLDAPVFMSGDGVRFFLFTSQIVKAADAAKRGKLEVCITALAGEIQVAAAVLNATGTDGATKEELLAGAFRDPRAVGQEGSRHFVSRDLHQRCGAALVCQLLLRVRSRPGHFADYMAVATDNSNGPTRKSEVLLLGVPVSGCVGGNECPGEAGNSAQYQLYLNNPSAKVRVRLSCEGPDRDSHCKQVVLSADARPSLPEQWSNRKYTTVQSNVKGELEFVVGDFRGTTPGQCHMPCVLLIRVETKHHTSIQYELSAASDDAYVLLVDGGEPVTAVAEPSQPQYFLFDSRRSSPLLTLSVQVPYDTMDPQIELVSMYVLDCDILHDPSKGSLETGRVSPSALEDPLMRPSAEHYKYRAIPNSRGQLVALIAPDPSANKIDEGRHCYYRIAVISHRVHPFQFSIRGFDWNPASALLMGDPLEGMVDRHHTFTYMLESSAAVNSAASPRVVLSLEVCRGHVQLRTAAHGPVGVTGSGAGTVWKTLAVDGGLPPTEVSLEENRWLEVASTTTTLGSYILTAEDPQKREWLEAVPNRQLSLTQESTTSVTLAWPVAKIFGTGHHPGGAGGAEYEVFYGKVGNVPHNSGYVFTGNDSTPCGLYFNYRYKRAQRVFAQTRQTVTINHLDATASYVFNVVAKHPKTGHSIAYHPTHRHGSPEALLQAQQPGAVASWGPAGPAVVVGIGLMLFVMARPYCKGNQPIWRGFELELPSWDRRARRFDAFSFGGSGAGGYAPPSVVGQSMGTPYSQIRS